MVLASFSVLDITYTFEIIFVFLSCVKKIQTFYQKYVVSGSIIAINSAMIAITTKSSMSVNPAHLERFLLTRPDNNLLFRPAILLSDRPNFLAPHIMALLLIDDDSFNQRPDYI